MKPRVHRTNDIYNGTIVRRWSLEVLEALADDDPVRMKVAFETAGAEIDTQVVSYQRGAPFEYGEIGLYDKGSGKHVDAIVSHVVEGDTALLIALRQKSPQLVQSLLPFKPNLELSNSLNEKPLAILWKMKLNGKDDAFDGVFELLKEELKQYHADMFENVRQQMIDIYTEHHPSRIRKIPMQMEQYYGKEDELLALVKKKYEIS